MKPMEVGNRDNGVGLDAIQKGAAAFAEPVRASFKSDSRIVGTTCR